MAYGKGIHDWVEYQLVRLLVFRTPTHPQFLGQEGWAAPISECIPAAPLSWESLGVRRFMPAAILGTGGKMGKLLASFPCSGCCWVTPTPAS